MNFQGAVWHTCITTTANGPFHRPVSAPKRRFAGEKNHADRRARREGPWAVAPVEHWTVDGWNGFLVVANDHCAEPRLHEPARRARSRKSARASPAWAFGQLWPTTRGRDGALTPRISAATARLGHRPIGNFANEMTALLRPAKIRPTNFPMKAITEGIGPDSRRVFSNLGLFFFDYEIWTARLDLLTADGHLENESSKIQGESRPTRNRPSCSGNRWRTKMAGCFRRRPAGKGPGTDLFKPIVGARVRAFWPTLDGDGRP